MSSTRVALQSGVFSSGSEIIKGYVSQRFALGWNLVFCLNAGRFTLSNQGMTGHPQANPALLQFVPLPLRFYMSCISLL